MKSFLSVAPLGLAVILVPLVAACGGPDLQFDPTPAPPWIRAIPDVTPRSMTAVGSSSVTPHPALDLDLARRDALHQIASMVRARVEGHTSAWQGQITGSDGTTEQELSSQTVDVRTKLPVEGAEVVASYRDELTATAYVKVRVNTARWASRVNARLVPALEQGEKEASAAEGLLRARDVFGAMEAVGRALKAWADASGDAGALEVLRPGDGWGKRMTSLAERIRRVKQGAQKRTPFSVTVKGGTAESQRVARDSLGAFLAKRGFRVASGRGAIQVTINLRARQLEPQRVGRRVEYLAAAGGDLRVRDPRGREVSALALNLTGNSLEERASSPEQAEAAAMELAAHTLVSQFRSRLRQLWGL